jgi:hypothetical protein
VDTDDIPQRPLNQAADLAARNGHSTPTIVTKDNEQRANSAGVALPIVTRGAELAGREFTPLQWLVQDVLPRGALVVLAGRPKSGKSFFVFQAAHAIDAGTPFLGKRTNAAKTLYVAAEDGPRRINGRLRARAWTPTDTDFVFSLQPLDQGGIDQLRALIQRDAYGLVILDTLRRVTSARIDENGSGDMSEILAPLADIAHDTDTTFLVVHHVNKVGTEDPFNAIRGSGAIRGAYDQGIVLLRERREGDAESEALLCFEAKDFDAPDITIRWNAATCTWQHAGDAGQRERTRSNKAVLEALRNLWRETGDDTFDTETIAKALGIAKPNASAKLRDAAAATPPIVEYVQAKPAPGTKGGRPADRWRWIDAGA